MLTEAIRWTVMAAALASVAGQRLNEQPASGRRDSSSVNTQPATHEAPAEWVEGLWPSPRLIRLLLVRATDDIAGRYDITDDQRTALRESIVKRWTPFLTDNRSTIQPVINEFIEMRLGLEPPSPEQMRTWAEKATPVLECLRRQVDQSTNDFRKVLSPAQRTEFELQAMQLGLGMSLAEQKLSRWRSGEFNAMEIWKPTGRRARTEELDANVEASDTGPTGADMDSGASPIAVELDAWDKHVNEVIRTYRFDDAQRDAARSCLAELKSRAAAHCDRKRKDIARLEERIQEGARDAAELGEIKNKLVELYGPVDEMFAELKRRVDRIPTNAQRESVASPSDDPGDHSEHPKPAASKASESH